MNIDRVTYITLQAIKIDPGSLSKTKWNKLMFFTDLAFYTCDDESYSHRIYTGLRYIKMPYGPVVDGYNSIIDEVVVKNNLQVKTYCGVYSNISQYIEPVNPIHNDFPVSEFEESVVSNVVSKFIHLTAGKLSDFSHKLSVWKIPGMYESLDFGNAFYDSFKISEVFTGTFFQLVMA